MPVDSAAVSPWTQSLSGTRSGVWVVAILLAASVVRLHELGAQSLWMDEAFSVFASRPPMGQALSILLVDGVHPPLYYFFQKFSFLLGGGEFVLRWPAAMFGIMGVAAIARLGREWFGRAAGVLSAVLLGLSPFAVWYGREARMYSLFMLLAIGVMAAFARWLSTAKPDARLGFAFTALSSAVYLTHYFGLFLPLVQFVLLLGTFRRHHRRLRAWVAAQSIAAVPIGLWVVGLYRSNGSNFGIGWIHPPAWTDPYLTVQNLLVGYGPEIWRWAATVALTSIAAFGVWAIAQKKPTRDRALILALWFILPIGATLALSVRRPTYVDRFLIASLPPLMLALAVGLRSLPRPRLTWLPAAVGLFAGLAMGAGTFLLLDRQAFPREDWRAAAQYIQASERPGDVLLLRSIYYRLPLDYYYRGKLESVGMDAADARELPAEGAPGSSRVWLVYRGRLEDAHQFATSLLPDLPRDERDADVVDWMGRVSPYLVERRDFPGVVVYLYDWSSAAASGTHGRAWIE